MSLPEFKQCPCCGSAVCFGWDVRVEYAPNDVDLFKSPFLFKPIV